MCSMCRWQTLRESLWPLMVCRRTVNMISLWARSLTTGPDKQPVSPSGPPPTVSVSHTHTTGSFDSAAVLFTSSAFRLCSLGQDADSLLHTVRLRRSPVASKKNVSNFKPSLTLRMSCILSICFCFWPRLKEIFTYPAGMNIKTSELDTFLNKVRMKHHNQITCKLEWGTDACCLETDLYLPYVYVITTLHVRTGRWDCAVSQTGGVHQLRHRDPEYQASPGSNDLTQRLWAYEQTDWFPVLHFTHVTFICAPPGRLLPTVGHAALWSANVHHQQELLLLRGWGYV